MSIHFSFDLLFPSTITIEITENHISLKTKKKYKSEDIRIEGKDIKETEVSYKSIMPPCALRRSRKN